MKMPRTSDRKTRRSSSALNSSSTISDSASDTKARSDSIKKKKAVTQADPANTKDSEDDFVDVDKPIPGDSETMSEVLPVVKSSAVQLKKKRPIRRVGEWTDSETLSESPEKGKAIVSAIKNRDKSKVNRLVARKSTNMKAKMRRTGMSFGKLLETCKKIKRLSPKPSSPKDVITLSSQSDSTDDFQLIKEHQRKGSIASSRSSSKKRNVKVSATSMPQKELDSHSEPQRKSSSQDDEEEKTMKDAVGSADVSIPKKRGRPFSSKEKYQRWLEKYQQETPQTVQAVEHAQEKVNVIVQRDHKVADKPEIKPKPQRKPSYQDDEEVKAMKAAVGSPDVSIPKKRGRPFSSKEKYQRWLEKQYQQETVEILSTPSSDEPSLVSPPRKRRPLLHRSSRRSTSPFKPRNTSLSKERNITPSKQRHESLSEQSTDLPERVSPSKESPSLSKKNNSSFQHQPVRTSERPQRKKVSPLIDSELDSPINTSSSEAITDIEVKAVPSIDVVESLDSDSSGVNRLQRQQSLEKWNRTRRNSLKDSRPASSVKQSGIEDDIIEMFGSEEDSQKTPQILSDSSLASRSSSSRSRRGRGRGRSRGRGRGRGGSRGRERDYAPLRITGDGGPIPLSDNLHGKNEQKIRKDAIVMESEQISNDSTQQLDSTDVKVNPKSDIGESLQISSDSSPQKDTKGKYNKDFTKEAQGFSASTYQANIADSKDKSKKDTAGEVQIFTDNAQQRAVLDVIRKSKRDIAERLQKAVVNDRDKAKKNVTEKAQSPGVSTPQRLLKAPAVVESSPMFSPVEASMEKIEIPVLSSDVDILDDEYEPENKQEQSTEKTKFTVKSPEKTRLLSDGKSLFKGIKRKNREEPILETLASEISKDSSLLSKIDDSDPYAFLETNSNSCDVPPITVPSKKVGVNTQNDDLRETDTSEELPKRKRQKTAKLQELHISNTMKKLKIAQRKALSQSTASVSSVQEVTSSLRQPGKYEERTSTKVIRKDTREIVTKMTTPEATTDDSLSLITHTSPLKPSRKPFTSSSSVTTPAKVVTLGSINRSQRTRKPKFDIKAVCGKRRKRKSKLVTVVCDGKTPVPDVHEIMQGSEEESTSETMGSNDNTQSLDVPVKESDSAVGVLDRIDEVAKEEVSKNGDVQTDSMSTKPRVRFNKGKRKRKRSHLLMPRKRRIVLLNQAKRVRLPSSGSSSGKDAISPELSQRLEELPKTLEPAKTTFSSTSDCSTVEHDSEATTGVDVPLAQKYVGETQMPPLQKAQTSSIETSDVPIVKISETECESDIIAPTQPSKSPRINFAGSRNLFESMISLSQERKEKSIEAENEQLKPKMFGRVAELAKADSVGKTTESSELDVPVLELARKKLLESDAFYECSKVQPETVRSTRHFKNSVIPKLKIKRSTKSSGSDIEMPDTPQKDLDKSLSPQTVQAVEQSQEEVNVTVQRDLSHKLADKPKVKLKPRRKPSYQDDEEVRKMRADAGSTAVAIPKKRGRPFSSKEAYQRWLHKKYQQLNKSKCTPRNRTYAGPCRSEAAIQRALLEKEYQYDPIQKVTQWMKSNQSANQSAIDLASEEFYLSSVSDSGLECGAEVEINKAVEKDTFTKKVAVKLDDIMDQWEEGTLDHQTERWLSISLEHNKHIIAHHQERSKKRKQLKKEAEMKRYLSEITATESDYEKEEAEESCKTDNKPQEPMKTQTSEPKETVKLSEPSDIYDTCSEPDSEDCTEVIPEQGYCTDHSYSKSPNIEEDKKEDSNIHEADTMLVSSTPAKKDDQRGATYEGDTEIIDLDTTRSTSEDSFVVKDGNLIISQDSTARSSTGKPSESPVNEKVPVTTDKTVTSDHISQEQGRAYAHEDIDNPKEKEVCKTSDGVEKASESKLTPDQNGTNDTKDELLKTPEDVRESDNNAELTVDKSDNEEDLIVDKSDNEEDLTVDKSDNEEDFALDKLGVEEELAEDNEEDLVVDKSDNEEEPDFDEWMEATLLDAADDELSPTEREGNEEELTEDHKEVNEDIYDDDTELVLSQKHLARSGDWVDHEQDEEKELVLCNGEDDKENEDDKPNNEELETAGEELEKSTYNQSIAKDSKQTILIGTHAATDADESSVLTGNDQGKNQRMASEKTDQLSPGKEEDDHLVLDGAEKEEESHLLPDKEENNLLPEDEEVNHLLPDKDVEDSQIISSEDEFSQLWSDHDDNDLIPDTDSSQTAPVAAFLSQRATQPKARDTVLASVRPQSDEARTPKKDQDGFLQPRLSDIPLSSAKKYSFANSPKTRDVLERLICDSVVASDSLLEAANDAFEFSQQEVPIEISDDEDDVLESLTQLSQSFPKIESNDDDDDESEEELRAEMEKWEASMIKQEDDDDDDVKSVGAMSSASSTEQYMLDLSVPEDEEEVDKKEDENELTVKKPTAENDEKEQNAEIEKQIEVNKPISEAKDFETSDHKTVKDDTDTIDGKAVSSSEEEATQPLGETEIPSPIRISSDHVTSKEEKEPKQTYEGLSDSSSSDDFVSLGKEEKRTEEAVKSAYASSSDKKPAKDSHSSKPVEWQSKKAKMAETSAPAQKPRAPVFSMHGRRGRGRGKGRVQVGRGLAKPPSKQAVAGQLLDGIQRARQQAQDRLNKARGMYNAHNLLRTLASELF